MIVQNAEDKVNQALNILRAFLYPIVSRSSLRQMGIMGSSYSLWKDYFIEDLTEQQQMMVNHIADLDRKIRSTQFNLDQLNVGKDAFVNMLTASLATETETE